MRTSFTSPTRRTTRSASSIRFDSIRNEVLRILDVGKRPRGLTFSHDYQQLFTCASDSDAVQVMDVATETIVAELPSGEDPEQFVLHPDNRHLYIANEDDAVATVVDIESRTVVAQIDVGVEPEEMAVSHDGASAIVTSERDQTWRTGSTTRRQHAG